MPKHYVNLDALIVREDIFSIANPLRSLSASTTKSIKINDLTPNGGIFLSLRKPDFQRETANWEPEKVVELVQCFLTGSFIPSIILWLAPDGRIFVIDGAHRLSALIAWVHDDYGDRQISRKFFNNFIPPGQAKVADKTRKLMDAAVGSYQTIMTALANAEHSDPKHVEYGRKSSVFEFYNQWVTGDPSTAEASFKKINQNATLIDKTEFQMIESRKKPNALAARALIRAGVGHKYWSSFPKPTQERIATIAKEIYDMLFIPEIDDEYPKTLDLPIAGKGYSAESIKLIFDFVNLANGLVETQTKIKLVLDDPDGVETLNYLNKIRRIIARICSNDNCSLGLHPAVYFYSMVGRYQPTAFLAIVSFILELDENDGYADFTLYRARFEEFLVSHRYFINQIVNQFGSNFKAQAWVLRLYKIILNNIRTGAEQNLVNEIISMKDWRLKELPIPGSAFSSQAKAAVVLKKSLSSAMKCSICGARIHRNSMQIDHVVRRQDGGSGHSDNGDVAHPYCNTGYKEHRHLRSAGQ
jgi:hypothetical protein